MNADRDYNQRAWDRQVAKGNRWTLPVSSELIVRARKGDWSVVVTPETPVPRGWFPPIKGCDLLCLASGGGQQGPLLAAAGAQVTVFDLSGAQLEQDRAVAARDGLSLRTVQGDMRDLSVFSDDSFDCVLNPCSTCFVDDVNPVWRECARVLRPGGVLITGFLNPWFFIFDYPAMERGELVARFALPYSDLTSLSAEERAAFEVEDEPYAFSHTLTDQIGGQLKAGFRLTDLFEDGGVAPTMDKLAPTSIATRAVLANM